jgi:Delta24-sterol reductase
MDCLVEATLKHGVIPLVVMEFPGIRVSSGFADHPVRAALISQSTIHKSKSILPTCSRLLKIALRYGSFDRTINWIKVILPNGVKDTTSSTENRTSSTMLHHPLGHWV